MEIKDNKIIFSSGRTRYANHGIIGLSQQMQVLEGYDGGIYSDDEEESFLDKEERLSHKDLVELANHMIKRWKEFRRMYKR